MSSAVDTSAEAVEREICSPIIAYVSSGRMMSEHRLVTIIDTARALAAERDALRLDLEEMTAIKDIRQNKRHEYSEQLAEARNAALLQAIGAVVAECTAPEGTYDMRTEKAISDAEAGTIAVAISAIKVIMTPTTGDKEDV